MSHHYSSKPGLLPVILTLTALILLTLFTRLHSAPLRDVPQQLHQPDGTVLHCFASGDEFHNWLHDENGFTIIQHPETGFYVFAEAIHGTLMPTKWIAGRDDPAGAGIQPHANIPARVVDQRRMEFNRLMDDAHRREFDGVAKTAYQQASLEAMNNIVIFIRFSDESEFDQQSSFYDDLYNKQGASVLSLYEYYQEASYGQFEVFSTFYPVPTGNTVLSYRDAHPRAYYRKKSTENPQGYEGDQERIQREHLLLKNAVEHVESQIPQHISLDNNNNGMVDGVSFIVRGSPEGWNELLWPHRFILFSQEVEIHGKRVWDYTFQLQVECPVTHVIKLHTIAHEMFHVLGAPDLYRYDDSGLIPVGPWDLMGWTGTVPPHMSGYMKYIYSGWIEDMPLITESGTYELAPLHTGKNVYKIPSAHSPYEFFVVEYRRLAGRFDSSLPGEGLIVHRINARAEGFGDHYAPDEVYVYRPDGTLTENGRFLEANYSANMGRTEISDVTSPSAFLSDGSSSGLTITNIGSAGETITFDVIMDYDPPALIRHDHGGTFVSVGTGAANIYEVAVRLTPDELAGHYGRALTGVVLSINDGCGDDITLKVWEGGSTGDAGTQVYSEAIGDRVAFGTWSVHELSQPVTLQEGLEYWIGYHMNATGGHPLVFDGGPAVQGKGAWIRETDGWTSFDNYGFNNNLRIRAAVASTGSAMLSLSEEELYLEIHPDRTKSVVFRISNPGNAPLAYSVSASGGETPVAKIAVLDLQFQNQQASGLLNQNGQRNQNGLLNPHMHQNGRLHPNQNGYLQRNEHAHHQQWHADHRMNARGLPDDAEVKAALRKTGIQPVTPSMPLTPSMSARPGNPAMSGKSLKPDKSAMSGSPARPGLPVDNIRQEVAGQGMHPASGEKVLILDDGNNLPDGFLGYGGGNYFYWRNDFSLEEDFNLEKIRVHMKTESQSSNPVEILVADNSGSFVFDTTVVFDLSSMGKWHEFAFPRYILESFRFKKNESFSLVVGSLNAGIEFPAGYDAEGLKPGFSYYGYFAYIGNQWIFSGWANLKAFFPKGAFLIRAVGTTGSTAENEPPVAIAGVSPNPAGIMETVTFHGADSYDPDGNIVQYSWDFGDGEGCSQVNTTHSYSQPGEYTYRLTVTDNEGAAGEAAGQISITDSPSRWTANPSSGTIAAGSYKDIRVSFDSEGLAEGNYTGEVEISSNAGNRVLPVHILISRDVGVDDRPMAAWRFRLDQNYPNPFNPGTTIRWEMGTEEQVSLTLYDITGRQITRLLHERREAGVHEIHFDASHLSSGVYLYRIRMGEFSDVKPMLLLK